MKKQYLKEGWELCFGERRLSASIPFSLYYDLYRHGVIEDPFYRDNESKVFPLAEHDYVYQLNFDAEEELLNCPNIHMKLYGVDTLAELYLNDVRLGETYNMFRSWEFSVKDLLQRNDNCLRLHFHSPIQYMREQVERHGAIPCNTDTLDGFPFLRKASYMSGWDWAPRLPDMGIIGNVCLSGGNQVRFKEVQIRQQHEPGQVKLLLKVRLEDWEGRQVQLTASRFTYQVILTEPEGRQHVFGDSPDELLIEQPLLWWPNGFGEQFLYELKVELLVDHEVVDTWQKKLGLRSMKLAREQDQWGEGFAHEVNGVKIFAMGADYVPEDSLLPRVKKAATRKLLKQCKAANYNTIRVWGGGYYPSDWFYDLCDELGFLVWQDLMFTCSTYLLTDDFEQNIREEIIENVRRIRHHACLAIWCGNNEIEGFLYDGYGETMRLREDYTRIFSYIIPKLMAKEDPDTFYWPSSPSSGGDFDNPHDETRGDAHYWQVWHGYKPFPDYRKHNFRYASEFGFESLPALKTIEAFTEPVDRNIFSYVMERHQKSSGGYAKMMNYVAQTFLYPKDLAALVYTSQIMQAEAMKYAVEHYRRHRGQCMGAVVWQLNDCWPVASWSSIDYFGRLKALHYYEKRFFAPIMISCCEEGQLTQELNPNARPYNLKKSIRLNIANETRGDVELLVVWSLRDSESRLIGEEHREVIFVPALSSVWLDEVNLEEARLYEDHVSYACISEGEILSEGSVIFSVPKFYQYKDPKHTVRVKGDELIVSAAAYAKGVELFNQEEDLVLADNFFDMEAGEKRVRILSGNSRGVTARSVYHIANE